MTIKQLIASIRQRIVNAGYDAENIYFSRTDALSQVNGTVFNFFLEECNYQGDDTVMPHIKGIYNLKLDVVFAAGMDAEDAPDEIERIIAHVCTVPGILSRDSYPAKWVRRIGQVGQQFYNYYNAEFKLDRDLSYPGKLRNGS